MDIKKLQDEVNARWSKQLGNPCHRSADPNHALIHIMKATGKIASALNDAEHEGRQLNACDVDKYLADLVICAARFGEGFVDLDIACETRLAEKFPTSAAMADVRAEFGPEAPAERAVWGVYDVRRAKWVGEDDCIFAVVDDGRARATCAKLSSLENRPHEVRRLR
jgi:hypothetical protein